MGLWYEPNLLIDGELVAAEGGATFASVNPATEEVIAEAADASVADVERAIAAARRAFDETTWSTDAKFRATCLRQLAAAMRDNLEDLRTLTIAEVGVPIGMTSGAALEGPIEILDYYADLAEKYEPTTDLGLIEAYGGQHRRWIEREPYGVVSAISAYNYPTQLNLAKLAPALAAGCTVVLKGAPDTPLITLALGKLIAENTDIPAGVVSVLTSSKVETGVVMTTDPERRHDHLHRVDRGRQGDHDRRQRHAEEDVPRTRREVGVPRARRRVGRLRRDDGRDGHVFARRPGLRDPLASRRSP